MGTLTATSRHRKDIQAAAVRRRAATLFDPPPNHGDRAPDPRTGAADHDAPASAPAYGDTMPPPPPSPHQNTRSPDELKEGPPAVAPHRRRRDTFRIAILERLPVWLSVRCGAEPKTVAALTLVLLIATGFAAHHFWTGRPHTVAVPPATRTALPRPSPGPPATVVGQAVRNGQRTPLYVDVAGKVRRPGLRRLPTGSRVADAVRAAGGALPDVDTSTLNLARVLVDGEQILVGAPAPPSPGATPSAPATGGGTGIASAPTPTPISLSTATLEQLDTLPGVGPVLAQHILDYRTQHNGFTSVDQLRDVTGIGDRRFADLKPLVRP
jgi:competence protein ComEA